MISQYSLSQFQSVSIPLPTVSEVFRELVVPVPTQPHPRGDQAVQVRDLRTQVYPAVSSSAAYPNTHRYVQVFITFILVFLRQEKSIVGIQESSCWLIGQA